ncbi:MAG: NAD-binding protein, partial [Cumulibacter sp.]
IVIVGRFVLTPWLRWVASLQVVEALTSVTLALVVGITWLMNAVGLSPALGTFVAGVMLASSEFRHELESNIEPFKSLLLAVFFISVGAGINFTLIAESPLAIGAMVAGLIVLKGGVLYALARVFHMSFDQRVLFAAALAQGGEFAFVLCGFAVGQGVLGVELASQMVAAVALSMVFAPPLLIFVQRVILPRFGTTQSGDEREHDVGNDKASILLLGFGRFGHPLGRLLRSAGYEITVLEKDSDHVDFLRKIGVKCYYGDASRLNLLQAAGADEADVLVLAIDDEEESMGIVETCRKHFPELTLFARACSRDHACRLHKAGVRFFGEQLSSSLDCAIAVLVEMGHESEHAKDAARRFKEFEVEAIKNSSDYLENEKHFIGLAQQNIRALDSLLLNAPLPIGGMRRKQGAVSSER